MVKVSSKFLQTHALVKLISNKNRFAILELTQTKSRSIAELSRVLELSYSKCADYVTMLAKQGAVTKTKKGKEVLIKSKVRISEQGVYR